MAVQSEKAETLYNEYKAYNEAGKELAQEVDNFLTKVYKKYSNYNTIELTQIIIDCVQCKKAYECLLYGHNKSKLNFRSIEDNS